ADRNFYRIRTRSGFGELRFPPDHVDLVLLHQEADAAVKTCRHTARALHHSLHIRRNCAFQLEAVILGMLTEMQDFSRAQQRLGWYATPVEANAAQMFTLNDSRLEAKLRSADCGDITTRARADNNNVVNVGHIVLPLLSSLLG